MSTYTKPIYNPNPNPAQCRANDNKISKIQGQMDIRSISNPLPGQDEKGKRNKCGVAVNFYVARSAHVRPYEVLTKEMGTSASSKGNVDLIISYT